VVCHLLRDFQLTAVAPIYRNPTCLEAEAAYLDLYADVNGAPRIGVADMEIEADRGSLAR
jgi:hypothetical protein